jgi:hypothetical protein
MELSMKIENARWADASRSVVVADINGARSWIPADPGNMHFAHLLAQGEGAIADPEGQDEPARPTLDDLAAENEVEPSSSARRTRKMSA